MVKHREARGTPGWLPVSGGPRHPPSPHMGISFLLGEMASKEVVQLIIAETLAMQIATSPAELPSRKTVLGCNLDGSVVALLPRAASACHHGQQLLSSVGKGRKGHVLHLFKTNLFL